AIAFNFLAACFLLYLLRGTEQRLVLFVAMLFTPFLYSSLLGFSTLTFSAAFVLCIYAYLSRSQWFYLSILLLCLIRPDGVVWGSGLVLLRLIDAKKDEYFSSEVMQMIIHLVVPGISYFVWRVWYFGEWLPLPFLVKATGERDFLIFYRDSLHSVLVVFVPLLIGISLNRDARLLKRFIMFFGIPVIFYATMRLEQNIGNRFMAPLFFGGLYLVLVFCEARYAAILVALSVYPSINTAVGTLSNLLSSRYEVVYQLSKDLSAVRGRMLITEAGRLAYYSNWVVDDSWGLNTPRFAHSLIATEDVTRSDYDLVVAHCDLQLLRQDTISAGTSRSWSNQCGAIVSAIKDGSFYVYLVPFHSRNIGLRVAIKEELGLFDPTAAVVIDCQRYDIYAVQKKSAIAEEIKNIMIRNSGIQYSSKVQLLGWDRACRP
ncbi:MAG: hypothetical protein ACK4MV_18800, partial [Beijerinckiaceae bacterium]